MIPKIRRPRLECGSLRTVAIARAPWQAAQIDW